MTRRWRTYGSRWGPGKVHRLYGDPGAGGYLPCSPKYLPHGREVPADTAVTCKKCMRWRP